ncbi:hypothetical protein M8J75_014333 [Diaphorina citri]|nr:hypothetical protein M8J75_014333 [Diaphorina citri]KAI5708115.1 hypothetical protein M8J77_016633 [Diaphorina citri]
MDLSEPTMAKVHVFKAEMTCDGCSSAITRILDRMKDKGVESVECSLPDQTVKVKSTLDPDVLLEAIKKSGKTCSYIGEGS